MTNTSPPPQILHVENLVKRYGSLAAVDGVTLEVARGERRALIGPNGAGKTTLFDMIGGVTPPTSGRIRFEGDDITRLPEHRRAERGMAKTFQHSNLLGGMTAADNVAVGVQRQLRLSRKFWRATGSYHAVDERVQELLERVGLTDKRGATAAALSHGERRQLEVAVALATEPRIILLDEPVAGMSAAETAQFIELVESLPGELTLLLIEHDMDLVFRLASTVTVLHAGAVLAEGTPEEVRASKEVQEAYLGSSNVEELFHT